MKRFIEGQVRSQLTLMPESLEDYIGADNPVRVIDAFVDALDLAEMGFDAAVVATDHGFILLHEQGAGNVAPKPAGNWLVPSSG